MKIHRSHVFILGLLGCLLQLWLISAATAQALPDGVQKITEVEGISEYRLDNGLRVLLFPDPSKPTVTVNITYLAGSRHENYGETGMAHLLEHLLFKDTAKHRDIPGEMKKRGISFNATTWLDRTNYFSSFAADEGTLDWLLALEADRMLNAPLRREDLDSEMTVVRNEMEAGENRPVGVLLSRIASVAHLWHNYGNSTIGARSDIENMPIERLQDFYRRLYRPDNATLLVAGRVDPVPTLGKIAAAFGALPRADSPLQTTYTREPTQDGERTVTVRRIGETRYLGFAYHGPAAAHPDFAALSLLSNILGDTPTGRLHKTLVEGKLATQVGAISHGLAEPGDLTFLAEAPKDGDFEALRTTMQSLLENLAEAPITAQELSDAQRRFGKSVELTMNDANRLALALSESIAQGDWRMYFLQRDRIEAVSLEDVNRVALAYFKPSNRTFGQFIPTAQPDRVEIAEAPAVASVLKDYRGRAAIAAGEAFDPSPSNIDARTQRATLANGTDLVLLPKQTRGSTVVLNGTFRFAAESALMNKRQAASFAASLLSRGSKNRSREDIARRLDEIKTQLSISGGTQTLSFSINTTREHLPAALELLAELLQHPAFPASEFEQLRSQAITAIESQMTEPQAIASNLLGRHFNHRPKGHPAYSETFEESLAALRALSLDDVRDFYQTFYGAGDGEIALVGDFDADAVSAQLDGLFGQWTRQQPFVRIEDPYQATELATLRAETPDKANAMWLARTEFALSDSDPDYPALLVANHVFGGGSLKSRLADRIRQTDGLSYAVGAQFGASAEDRNASLTAYAIAAPENIAAVDAAFRQEWAKLLAEGISEAELKDAVDGLLKARQRSRGEDPALVALLSSNAYLDRTLQWSAELEAKLAALDVAAVNAAMQRQFAQLKFSTAAAGDFAKLKAD